MNDVRNISRTSVSTSVDVAMIGCDNESCLIVY